MMLSYPVNIVEDDNDTFLVTAPDLPEVVTFGDTYLEALEHGRNAIEEAIAARLQDFDTIPLGGGGDVRVEISLQMSLKVTLAHVIKTKKMNRADLQRLLKWNRTSVERLFKPNHATRIDRFDEAFRALNTKLRIETEENDVR
jgi:antitoxin HicB